MSQNGLMLCDVISIGGCFDLFKITAIHTLFCIHFFLKIFGNATNLKLTFFCNYFFWNIHKSIIIQGRKRKFWNTKTTLTFLVLKCVKVKNSDLYVITIYIHNLYQCKIITLANSKSYNKIFLLNSPLQKTTVWPKI